MQMVIEIPDTLPSEWVKHYLKSVEVFLENKAAEQPFENKATYRHSGALKNNLVIPNDFDDPLPDEILELFYPKAL